VRVAHTITHYVPGRTFAPNGRSERIDRACHSAYRDTLKLSEQFEQHWSMSR